MRPRFKRSKGPKKTKKFGTFIGKLAPLGAAAGAIWGFPGSLALGTAAGVIGGKSVPQAVGSSLKDIGKIGFAIGKGFVKGGEEGAIQGGVGEVVKDVAGNFINGQKRSAKSYRGKHKRFR